MSGWEEIIKTIKKVNQEVIVMDKQETLVVMSLARYNNLLDTRVNIQAMTEEEFLNEINRQVAIWRAGQEDYSDSQYEIKETLTPDKPNQSEEEGDTFYIEPVE